MNSINKEKQAVRGDSPLDNLLAYFRRKIAYARLKAVINRRRCLDVGCGNYPLLLIGLDFVEKYGIEKQLSITQKTAAKEHHIQIRECDLQLSPHLPFEDSFFDAVTMLAVIEHLSPPTVPFLLKEIHRVLVPGGLLVLTTPAAWTDGLLRTMAGLGIISRVEIDDHKDVFTRLKLADCLKEAGFAAEQIHTGLFECAMNIWATARKN